MTLNNIKHICTYCDKRHGGCSIDGDKWEKLLEGEFDCDEFVLGKCFYCIVNQEDNDNTVACLCSGYGDVFYPQGCDNFKAGLNYEDYLIAVEQDNARDMDIEVDKGVLFETEKERQKALRRRKNSKRYNSRMLRKARENKGWSPGPYFDETIGRVKIWDRGKRSRWLKQQAHRRMRRLSVQNEFLYQHGQHKKLFDYWWELL